MRVLVCDLETTGFSREHCDIIEIAGIVYDDTTNEDIDVFHEYLKPRAKIPAAVTELTGITNKDVMNCLSTGEMLPQFYKWCEENKVDVIVGHNFQAFDRGFLVAKSQFYNIKNFVDYPVIDTLKIAKDLVKKGKINVENCKQPTLAEYFGIQYRAHSAIEDIKALKQIYLKMQELM